MLRSLLSVVLCCVVLCCVVLCCVFVVLCCVVLCRVVLVVLCCVVLCCVVWCCIVLCCVVSSMVWCGVLCGVRPQTLLQLSCQRHDTGVYISDMGPVVVLYTRADGFTTTPKFIANVQNWNYRGAGRIGSEVLPLMGKSGGGARYKALTQTMPLLR